MAERIHSYGDTVIDPEGVRYRVHAYGERRERGAWTGWLLYEPLKPGIPSLRTERETTQVDREDLVYWAEGLEHVYLEGALDRAEPV